MPPIKKSLYCQFCFKNTPHKLIKAPRLKTKKENSYYQNPLIYLSYYIDLLLRPSYQVCQICAKKTAKIETLPY